jgi:hypothetical protein
MAAEGQPSIRSRQDRGAVPADGDVGRAHGQSAGTERRQAHADAIPADARVDDLAQGLVVESLIPRLPGKHLRRMQRGAPRSNPLFIARRGKGARE